MGQPGSGQPGLGRPGAVAASTVPTVTGLPVTGPPAVPLRRDLANPAPGEPLSAASGAPVRGPDATSTLPDAAGRHRGGRMSAPGLAWSAVADAAQTPAGVSGIRQPGGLVRRSVAGSSATPDRPHDNGFASGPSSAAAASSGWWRALPSAERGPVVLRSMAGHRSVTGRMTEIAPASAGMLAGAAVAPRGPWRSGSPRADDTLRRIPDARTRPDSTSRPGRWNATSSLTGVLQGESLAPRAGGSTRPGGSDTAPSGSVTVPGGSLPGASATAPGGSAKAPSGSATVLRGSSTGPARSGAGPVGTRSAPSFAAPYSRGVPGDAPTGRGVDHGDAGEQPAARFVSSSALPTAVRRRTTTASLRQGGTSPAGAADQRWAREPGWHRAAAFGPGAVGALVVDHRPGDDDSAAANGPAPLRRWASGEDIVPGTGATLRAAMPRLALVPLRATGSAGGGDIRRSVPAAGSVQAASAAPSGPNRQAGHPSAPGGRPASAAAGADTAPTARTADALAGSTPIIARASTAAEPWFADGVPGGVRTGAAPIVPVRRSRQMWQSSRSSAGIDIHPATVELLRGGRVAPPRGVLVTAPGAPPVPASALEGSPDAVIRRSPGGGTARSETRSAAPGSAVAASPDERSSRTPGGTADTGSLIRRVPASLFERARAELRGAFAAQADHAAAAGPPIRRELALGSVSTEIESARSTQPAAVGGALTSREWDELVNEVVRRIEGRVTAELERRGRRSTPRIL